MLAVSAPELLPHESTGKHQNKAVTAPKVRCLHGAID